ncbi:MAG: ABC transporter ATP-binding protein [Acholeplasmatales bacterium]|nr:ABC transporter ATP-binding protein [Acholeplasmatales bacterium]MDD7394605.1 ABC transporter ATP-binding protein [Acholeplasmatales bacterium]MDY4016901.1 ABC transporter ATP-binding protein [Bacilli bacterium]CDD21883.1 hydroxymethylpyrimidine ABC transporter ATPase component [Firmicutes bacterium CAG:313]
MKKLEMKNVSKTFYTEIGALDVLEDITFNLNEGEIIAIVGPSGSGKSTLLNIISKLIEPTEGEIYVDGEIGYMFQRDHLFNWRTVWKNIMLGLEIKKEKNQENIDKTKELLTKYGLIDFINSYPQELSGGMRQRIALIRTLATNPQVLLLDEPFSALDYQTRINVSEDIFKMIKDSNVSAILVTHDISEAIAMADRVIVLSHRPAKLKKIIDIKTDSPDNTPFNKRLSSEFRKYFDEIWGLLNE